MKNHCQVMSRVNIYVPGIGLIIIIIIIIIIIKERITIRRKAANVSLLRERGP